MWMVDYRFLAKGYNLGIQQSSHVPGVERPAVSLAGPKNRTPHIGGEGGDC